MSSEQTRIRIAVLDRGHVLVGRCQDPESVGLWLRLTDARVIRRWGTTQGLAQLRSGPTAETVMDGYMPSVTLPVRALLYTIDELEEDAWEPHLTPPSAAGETANSGGRSSRTTLRRSAATG